ncbi:MAG: hypothetical protein V8R91_14605 [Butyricimonas faecihominis]
MTIIHGILECPLLNLGSKSEGRRAILTDDEGKKYKLYRAGILPAGDPFFIPYDGMHIGVSGSRRKKQGAFWLHPFYWMMARKSFLSRQKSPLVIPLNFPYRVNQRNH